MLIIGARDEDDKEAVCGCSSTALPPAARALAVVGVRTTSVMPKPLHARERKVPSQEDAHLLHPRLARVRQRLQHQGHDESNEQAKCPPAVEPAKYDEKEEEEKRRGEERAVGDDCQFFPP
jgi:hypothetical protein